MSICRCGSSIEPYRRDVLKSDKCAACAKRLAAMGMGAKKVKGRMLWDCKTSPTIEVMSEETYNDTKKYFPTKFGRCSAVHMVCKPTSSI